MESAMNFGSYALIQFCPIPERLEFLNVGLLLVVPEIDYFRIDFVEEPKRIERLFGRQSHAYFENVVQATKFRLKHLADTHALKGSFQEFSQRRANQIRLTNLLDLRVEGDPDIEFVTLFEKLVEGSSRRRTSTRARARLKSVFEDFRVDGILDKPEKVDLVEYDIQINVPFAYQNGHYNLIDAIRISENHSESLREIGKKAMEGQLLWESSSLFRQMKLIVVADFSEQSAAFFNAVNDCLQHSNVQLYRFDHVDLLVDDIKRHVDLG